MKTVIKENEQVVYKFPVLMALYKVKGDNTTIKRIVLFTGESEGILLYDNICETSIYKTANDWDISQFKPFSGQVVLSND